MRSYRLATVTAERVTESYTKLLAAQTEGIIQAIDLTLIGLRDTLQLAPGLPANDTVYQATLRARLKSLPYVRSLYVIGPQGYIIHGSDHPTTPAESLEDRGYFQAHTSDASVELHIGKPLFDPSLGAWLVSFSRRIENPDGSFAGVIVAALEPRYFKRFYKGLPLERDMLIALALKDGTLLARTPSPDAAIGRTYPEIPERIATVGRDGSVAWRRSPFDGKMRLLGFRAVANGTVLVIAGQAEESIYDEWLEHAAMVGGGILLVWLLASGLAVVLLRHRRRERLEHVRLAQGRRLEMMGRIAGGIAHDLGNTIRVARTTFTLLKPSLATQRDAMALVEDADRSLRSAFEIIDRLLAFGRRQELSPRPTDLAELITGFAPILRQAVGPLIKLELDVTKPLVCSIDPIHLESALLNLVLNSKDAMIGGGSIAITLSEVPAPRRRYAPSGSSSQPWAAVTVKDDGAGMSRTVRERAFEPLFTTRAGGSGLGLSQVLGFVQQSAGEVQLESVEGRGTTVRLLFPMIAVAPGELDTAMAAVPSSRVAGPQPAS